MGRRSDLAVVVAMPFTGLLLRITRCCYSHHCVYVFIVFCAVSEVK